MGMQVGKLTVPPPTAGEQQRERRYLREAVASIGNSIILGSVLLGISIIIHGLIVVS